MISFPCVKNTKSAIFFVSWRTMQLLDFPFSLRPIRPHLDCSVGDDTRKVRRINCRTVQWSGDSALTFRCSVADHPPLRCQSSALCHPCILLPWPLWAHVRHPRGHGPQELKFEIWLLDNEISDSNYFRICHGGDKSLFYLFHICRLDLYFSRLYMHLFIKGYSHNDWQ